MAKCPLVAVIVICLKSSYFLLSIGKIIVLLYSFSVSYDFPGLKYYEIGNEHVDQSLIFSNSLVINPFKHYESRTESLLIFISYDNYYVERPSFDDYSIDKQLIFEGYPESIHLDLDKVLTTGKIYISIFK